MIAATVGGTLSVIGGGKFKNGALSGAFVHAFNELLHPSSEAYHEDANDPEKNNEERVGTVRVRRFSESEQSTTGELSVDGEDVSGYTLEPPGPSSTTEGSGLRIPAGEYDLVPFNSESHPNVFQVDNVPGRSAILIHIGNYPGDTAGCLLPGTSYGTDAVWSSGQMMNTLRDTLQSYDRLRIIITDDF